ncbi:hypothetical protein [Halomonas aquatica]|uniref:Tetratricopeptide repeat-containing protein n=1 Tax=Halomonas aquatica TaxID=3151123 RepID=A0ABV1NGS9_9GAMM
MRNRILACSLLAGWLAMPALAEPALPGDIIADLQALQALLHEGEASRVLKRAETQAQRLAGGNGADRWSRALYLQLAAQAASRAGRPAEAADRLREVQAIALAPETWRLSRLREEAGLRHSAGQGKQAVALLQAWLDRTGGDAASRWRLVVWLAELERFDEAAGHLEALEAAEGLTTEQRALAVSLHRRADHEAQALSVLLAGLDAQAPAEDWRTAAALAQRVGDAGRAAAIWETGWRLGALAGEADLLRLARLHLTGGTPARAGDHLARALETGALADSLETRRLMARAWEAARDHDRALAAWRRVAKRSDAGDDWLRLGRLALAWGDETLAHTALRQASRRGIAQADPWLDEMRRERAVQRAQEGVEASSREAPANEKGD